MLTLEPGDVIAFGRYGETVSGIVVRKTWYAHAPAASTITCYSPQTTWLHSFSYPGNYRIVEQPDAATRAANVEEAHEWYRGQLLRYPAWRAFFDRHPDYRLF